MVVEIDNEELERRAAITLECGGVQPMHNLFYTYSVRYSAERAIAAFKQYDYLLTQTNDASTLISEVQEAILHVGALSRYFWPSPSGRKKDKQQRALRMQRGEYLKNLYKLTDDSPLANRELRNAWEHFDEKMDTYLLTQMAGSFFPSPIIGSHELADSPTGKIFKLLDPEVECLVLLGQKFFFAPLRHEVERIFPEFTK
ncbi:TPA: hypothetical protein NJ921_004529 [Vibrio parahaemolyticus]|uniref:Uncharacterized protein n=1 Tax=Vibrio hepatarius TaxID=171383 RepID=A0A0M0I6W3_9VIBR|nr:hypothetical protein AKJ31_04855 [Vibrio hepatarius]HCG8159259.1 hypothetical protein [Vibrio parahaemolyticus]